MIKNVGVYDHNDNSYYHRTYLQNLLSKRSMDELEKLTLPPLTSAS